MQKQNKVKSYNPSVCAWKFQSYKLQIVSIKQQSKKLATKSKEKIEDSPCKINSFES